MNDSALDAIRESGEAGPIMLAIAEELLTRSDAIGEAWRRREAK